MKLPFPEYLGRPMYTVDLPYLLFCYGRTRNIDFLNAFEKYYAGLRELVEKDGYHYEEFRVPFGKKHRGTRLRQCRDQRWLRWCSKKKPLTEKHPLFFRAVERWLANPQKCEKTRDVGELLSKSEYADGLDLETPIRYNPETDEEATDSDSDLSDFVVPDTDPVERDGEESDTLEEMDERIRLSSKKRSRNKAKPQPVSKKRTRKRARRKASRTNRSAEEETDGNESYRADSDFDDDPSPAHRPHTRSLAQKAGETTLNPDGRVKKKARLNEAAQSSVQAQLEEQQPLRPSRKSSRLIVQSGPEYPESDAEQRLCPVRSSCTWQADRVRFSASSLSSLSKGPSAHSPVVFGGFRIRHSRPVFV
ncbi:hypothetical protein DFH06DRAFT_308672 [Mycena polygramma]|nr:hypothetical protein DFH06DRAFT_308672 [Mycena polygramma]